ncbi:MAG: FAD binding domain-containing protein [Pseudomonadota bacterium]
MTTISKAKRAIIIGGSLGGLFAGTMLRRAGWDVAIYERSERDLDSRGGGIVLQPDVVEVFRAAGVDISHRELGVVSKDRIVYHRDGTLLERRRAPQTQTSWSLIYSTMKETFGDEHYHRGHTLSGIVQDDASKTVTATFSNGVSDTADLLVGADGNGSAVRQLLWPDAEPVYAGYIAWRGLVPEHELSTAARDGLAEHFGFSSTQGSHMLGYLVPGEGNAIARGERLYNWVWYRVTDDDTLRSIMVDRDGNDRGFSMPEGQLAERWKTHVYREADNLLPRPFREVVQSTKEPFAQAIRDLTVSSMVNGRVILLGDAAFVPRPHTAASTSKAAANALDLRAALTAMPDDVDAALARWEPQQLMLGQELFRLGSRAGQRLMFG